MYFPCEFCGEVIPYKECRTKRGTTWNTPVDQSHVYAECIPEDQRPANRFTREVCEGLLLVPVAQSVEAGDLKSPKCEFESRRGHDCPYSSVG